MINTGFAERTYRTAAVPAGLTAFYAGVKETDLWIAADRVLKEEALDSIRRHRAVLEAYILRNPGFADSLEPVGIDPDAAGLVWEMQDAAARAGVGPMAAVAGAIGEAVARDLAAVSSAVLVENGGDLYLIEKGKRTIGIWAGTSPLSGKVGVTIKPGDGLAVCTSSGTVGPSLSLGRADAAVVVSRSGALADAAATRLGNLVKSPDEIEGALEMILDIDGISGAIVVLGDALGAAGDVELVPVNRPAGGAGPQGVMGGR